MDEHRVELVSKSLQACQTFDGPEFLTDLGSLDEHWDEYQPLVSATVALLMASTERSHSTPVDLGFYETLSRDITDAWPPLLEIEPDLLTAVMLSPKDHSLVASFPANVYCYYACLVAGFLTRTWAADETRSLVVRAGTALRSTGLTPAE